ncbi:MAG: nucleotidyl transferase AbiEii/AbiGii toxin family protein [Deltaproteobacteria bacterium]|nr:MAG: nucleotidyl transferase AbiEii/AbiGii toxin family protein [Deltaproteobacteria bacterium]
MQRLIDHEALQMAILQWLGSGRFLGSLTFGEETMLRLCHELPRYSRDMDFWFFRQQDYEHFYNRLYDALSQDHDVTDAQNNLYSILVEIRRKKRKAKLKIEIHKTTAPPGSTEEKIAFSPHFPTQVLVRGFTLRQILKNKVLALVDRGKIRDAFDLEFLVRKGVALNLSERQRKNVVKRLKAFKRKDFEVKLGNILLPEMRDYYKQQGFAHLEERLSLEQWKQ